MKMWLDSLRRRLVASLLLMFSLGLGGALALRWLGIDRGGLGWLGLNVLREPYQDIAVLVPFSAGAIALIWVVSGWSLRHLALASRQAASVGPGNPEARISTGRLPGEVRPLVTTVNGALDRLAEAYAAEQRFVADAAHELRTPLTVLSLRLQRAKLEGTIDWSAIDQDVAQVNRLAGQLLDLARKEYTGRSAARSDGHAANLSRIAREAAAAVVPLADQAGRALDVELSAVLQVHGRPDDLRDMIRNLLDNAVAHGRGMIRLTGRVGAGRGGRPEAWLTVSDEGPGVPASHGEAMFDRFRKGDPQSQGHGLGLAIVREVARGHGGSVAFLPGPGCHVRIALPIAEIAA